MKNKEILIELINYLEEYENLKLDDNLEFRDFIGFLNSKLGHNSINERKIAGDVYFPDTQMDDTPESEIARLIGLMYRYAKHYIKKALYGSRIQTAEEFSFLIVLLTYESLTKSDLINKNLLEKTSGTEVIKRLINNNFIFQFDDPKDKRSQRVRITEEGKIELFKILPRMHSVSEVISGNLTNDEKNTLSYLLKKLDQFHHNIFVNEKHNSIEQLIHN